MMEFDLSTYGTTEEDEAALAKVADVVRAGEVVTEEFGLRLHPFAKWRGHPYHGSMTTAQLEEKYKVSSRSIRRALALVRPKPEPKTRSSKVTGVPSDDLEPGDTDSSWDALFGLAATANGAEGVKAAYRLLASKLHPDVNPYTAELFAEITDAYNFAKECYL